MKFLGAQLMGLCSFPDDPQAYKLVLALPHPQTLASLGQTANKVHVITYLGIKVRLLQYSWSSI